MKEDRAAALERHEKEMVELREKEAIAKTSTIEEYKSFGEVVERGTSMYFGEGFDLCKK